MMDIFQIWYGIGVISSLIAVIWFVIRVSDDFFLSHIFSLDTLFGLLLCFVFGLFGPLATIWYVRVAWATWSDKFPIDDDGNRIYPWRED